MFMYFSFLHFTTCSNVHIITKKEMQIQHGVKNWALVTVIIKVPHYSCL